MRFTVLILSGLFVGSLLSSLNTHEYDHSFIKSISLLSTHMFSTWPGSNEGAGAVVDNRHFYACQGWTEMQDSVQSFLMMLSLIYCHTAVS